MLNDWLLDFAEWLDKLPFSVHLHESFYMYNWIETTHVLTLMVSLGMLFVIGLTNDIDRFINGWGPQ